MTDSEAIQETLNFTFYLFREIDFDSSNVNKVIAKKYDDFRVRLRENGFEVSAVRVRGETYFTIRVSTYPGFEEGDIYSAGWKEEEIRKYIRDKNIEGLLNDGKTSNKKSN